MTTVSVTELKAPFVTLFPLNRDVPIKTLLLKVVLDRQDRKNEMAIQQYIGVNQVVTA